MESGKFESYDAVGTGRDVKIISSIISFRKATRSVRASVTLMIDLSKYSRLLPNFNISSSSNRSIFINSLAMVDMTLSLKSNLELDLKRRINFYIVA